jgi:hypothetical protein
MRLGDERQGCRRGIQDIRHRANYSHFRLLVKPRVGYVQWPWALGTMSR